MSTARPAPAASRSTSGGAANRRCTKGRPPPPPRRAPHEVRRRIALAYADLDAPPRRRSLDRGDPALVESARGLPPSACWHPRALGGEFNPVSFYDCFDARATRSGRRRRGDQHAVGRAPHVRPRARGGRPTRRSTSRRSWAWTTATWSAQPCPARPSRSTSEPPRGEIAFDATLTSGACVRPPAAGRRLDAHPGADLPPRAASCGPRASPYLRAPATGRLIRALLRRLERGYADDRLGRRPHALSSARPTRRCG